MSLVSLGDCYFSLYYSSVVPAPHAPQSHASMMLPNLTLMAGETTSYKTLVQFTVPDQPGPHRKSALQILSNFICCVPTEPIYLKGSLEKATHIPYLYKSLTSLNIQSVMPGLPKDKKMIESAILSISSPLASLASLSLPARMNLVNYFQTPITITKMKGSITHKSQPLAFIDCDLSEDPIILPPNSTTLTQQVWLKLSVGMHVIKSLYDFDTSLGVLLVDVEIELCFSVDSYSVADVKYVQHAVVSKIGFDL